MRVISRLDIKNDFVIKGVQFEGLKKVGSPLAMAEDYYNQSIDEIVLIDSVASLYERNNLFHIVEKAVERVFVPLCVGGGLRSVSDVNDALNAGADKVIINTAAVKNIDIIEQIASRFGAQCIVGSIEAKKRNDIWEVYTDYGREKTGLDVLTWSQKLTEAGIGELLLTSIDNEGTKRGFDLELVHLINSKLNKPLIVGGGFGTTACIDALLSVMTPSAVAIASALHYGDISVREIKNHIRLKKGL